MKTVLQFILVLLSPFTYIANTFAKSMTKNQPGDDYDLHSSFHFYYSLACVFMAYTIIAMCVLVFLQATGTFSLGHLFVATISVIAASVVTTIVVFVGESRG